VRIVLLPGANPDYGIIIDLYRTNEYNGKTTESVKVAWLRPVKAQQKEVCANETLYHVPLAFQVACTAKPSEFSRAAAD
jgi:hypothetical protein